MAKLYNLARMTTATTGTGTITLGAAVAGCLTFGQAGSVDGDIIYYALKDGNDAEIGIGTYTASGTTLSRDTVLNSTNSGAKINLSGTAEVFITPPASAFREVLTADRNYYVRGSDGSDTNNGLANTSGGAFKNIQKAIDTAATLDLSIYNVTINVASGTYTAPIVAKNCVGAGYVYIKGDVTTPSNVVINTTSANCFTATGVTSTVYQLGGFKLLTTTSGDCIYASDGSTVNLVALMEYGGVSTGNGHIRSRNSSRININANYTISGGAYSHWIADLIGIIGCNGRTITLTGTPAFTGGFCNSIHTANLYVAYNTFSGSATGARYVAATGGVIETFGGGANYLPGNSAGVVTSPGVYS